MTRRTVLSLIPGALFAVEPKPAGKPAAKPRSLPPARGEFVRYTDGVTENTVVRLTAPAHTSLLPAPENRFVSSREALIVFASDRAGSFAPFRANLRTGAIAQIAPAKAIDPRSLSLDFHERELWFVDDGELKTADLQHQKVRTQAEDVSEFHLGGRADIVVIRKGDALSLWTPRGSAPLADNVCSRGIVSPDGTGCVFCRQQIPDENEFWYAAFSGGKPRLLASGPLTYPYWRPDGQALLFLKQEPREGYIAAELREAFLDGSPEHAIAETSQFASFAPNSDGSVIVGASRSKAQPDIVLLVRSVRREMVLCEHRAQNAQNVSPAFSPNSQRVYFQSDHEGKSALYSVNVERLVEQTEQS